MPQPNWFDTKYEAKLKGATAQQALELIAKDGQLQKAVGDALKQHDATAGQPGYGGPSRSQIIRKAIAECLAAHA